MAHTRDLEGFLAVAEHLHMTRAAAGLFVTQPALSKRIASLERALDAQLFVRRHDGVALTAAGEALLPYARQIVELERQATAAVGRTARAGKLTIGFWISPTSTVLRAARESFAREFPELGLRLRRADWAEAAAGVVAGKAHAALVQVSHDRTPTGLRHRRVLVEDLVVALPVGHPLAGRSAVDPGELAGETLLVRPPEDGDPAPWRPRGQENPPVEYVSTIDETVDAVASGLGVCVLTPSCLAVYPLETVCAVPLRGVEPADLLVVWREQDESRPEVRALVRALVRAYGAPSSADA